MAGPVIVIGLDSGDRGLFDRWMAEGRLKTLKRLRETGAFAPVGNVAFGVAEAGWTATLAGVLPDKTGFWSQYRLDSESYTAPYVGSYDYKEYPPFYALGEDYRVAAIDIPQAALSDAVNGVQVLGYGAHSPQTPRESRPAELLPRLIATYGDHPTYETDHALLWKRGQMASLADRLVKGVALRGRICADMLRQERWDLFFTVFGEFHSAGHFLWHISEPDHPFHETYKNAMGRGRNPMLEVAEAIDAAMAGMIAAAPEDATVLVFSQEGMVPNNLDLPSMVFLPELMYRYSFPGRYGLGGGQPGENAPPGPMITKPHAFGWTRGTWSTKHDDNRLRSFLRRNLPMEVGALIDRWTGGPTVPHDPHKFYPHWNAPMWYSPEWPRMKAFGLPSFSHGYVRVNLKGRDGRGVVEPADYDRVCDEIVRHLRELRNARTGAPLARDVIRTRASAADDGPKMSDADVVAIWDDDPADVVDSPAFGRIGPIPHRRSSGHNTEGFAIAAGPGIAAGAELAGGHAIDIAPSALALLGAPIPERLDGTPIFPAPRATPSPRRRKPVAA